MDKVRENVITALNRCSEGMSCIGCPYEDRGDCREKLHEDTLALLKEEKPKANEAPKYSAVCIYTKKTDLLDYFNSTKCLKADSKEQYERMREYYAREREIQLIALFRWENGKCFCKIKCPINPLPVHGEFETASYDSVGRFLAQDGWIFKEKLYPRMFQ